MDGCCTIGYMQGHAITCVNDGKSVGREVEVSPCWGLDGSGIPSGDA